MLPLAENDTRAMLDGLAHRRPLVNGDSGFIPRAFDRAMELFEHGLDAEGLRFLRAVDVRHVVLAPTRRSSRTASARRPASSARRCSRWTTARRAGVVAGRRARGHALFEATGSRAQPGRAARRRTDRLRARDGPWLAQPRVEASLDGVQWEPLEATASLADATLSLYRDPRHARGEIRFAPRPLRLVRVDAQLPAREGALEVGESR